MNNSVQEQAELSAGMLRALELAARSPIYGENPQVGAVLINDVGEIIAEGWHKGAGTPHAEIDALKNLEAKGLTKAGPIAKGLTAVVTLEPCNHVGKTGPCSQALIEAGVKRVVFGSNDPGESEGGGHYTLEAAGVEVVSGILHEKCDQLIAPWLTNKFSKRPYVVIKWASSVDGRTAAIDGTSKWITGAEAREDVHARRAASQAIMVGTNTVELDDPELTSRRSDGSPDEKQPLRVVVGKRALSADAKVFNSAAETVHFETHDLKDVMRRLFERGIFQVFVEGGAQLESALIREGLADEFLIYLAPKLIGGPATAIRDIEVAGIDQALNLEFVETKRLGSDLLIRAKNAKSAISATKKEN